MQRQRHGICRPLTIMLSFLLLFCMVAFGNCINLERVRMAAAAVLSEQVADSTESAAFRESVPVTEAPGIIIRRAERGLLSLISDGEEIEDGSLFATRDFKTFPGAEINEENPPLEMPAVRKPGRSVSAYEKKTEEAAGDSLCVLFLLLLMFAVFSHRFCIPAETIGKRRSFIRLTGGRYPPSLSMN